MTFLFISEFLYFLNIFGDNFSVSDILSFDFAALIDLSSLEFRFFNSNLEFFSLFVKGFHFIVEAIS